MNLFIAIKSSTACLQRTSLLFSQNISSSSVTVAARVTLRSYLAGLAHLLPVRLARMKQTRVKSSQCGLNDFRSGMKEPLSRGRVSLLVIIHWRRLSQPDQHLSGETGQFSSLEN